MPSFECHHCLRHAPIKYVSKKEFMFSIGIGDIADVSVKQNFDSKFVNRKEMKVLFTIWITVVLIQEVVPSALIRFPRDATNRLSSVQTEYEAKYAQKGKHGNESYSTVRGKQEFHHDNCGENWNDFAEKCASLIKELIGSLAGVVSSQPGDATNLQLHIKNNFKHFDSSHNCSCFNHSKNALSDLDLTSLFNNLKTESETSEKDKIGCKNQLSHEEGHKDKSHSGSQNQNVGTPPLGALTMPEHPSMNPENAEGHGDGSNLCNRRQAKYPYNVLKNSDSFTHLQTTTPKNFPPPVFSGQTPKQEGYPTLSPDHPSGQKNNFLPTSATIQPVHSTILTPRPNLNVGQILSDIQHVKDSFKHPSHQIGSLLQNTNIKSPFELSPLQSTTHMPPQNQEKSYKLPSSHGQHQSSGNDCNQNKGSVLPAVAKTEKISSQNTFMPQVPSDNTKQGESSNERIPNNFKFQHQIQQPAHFQPSHQYDPLQSKGYPSSTESIKPESLKKEKSYQTPEYFPSVGVTPSENQLKPCSESGGTTKKRPLPTTFNPLPSEFLIPADALDKKPLMPHKSVEDSTQTPLFTFPTTQNPSVSAEIMHPEYQHQKPHFPLNLNSKQSILPKPIKMPHSHLSFPDSIHHKAEPTFSIPHQPANQQSVTTPSGFPPTSFDEENFQLSSSVTPKTENDCDKNKPNGLTTPGSLSGHLSQPNLPYLPNPYNPVLPSKHEDPKMSHKKNHEKEKPANFPSQTAFGVTDGKLSQPDSNSLLNDKLTTPECESRGTTKNGETSENETTETPETVLEETHELINKPNPNDLHHEKDSETSNHKSDSMSTPPTNIFESVAPTESQSDFHNIFHAHKTKVTPSLPLDVSSHSQEKNKENKEQFTHSSTTMPTDFSDPTDCPSAQNNPDENSSFNPKTPIPESSLLDKEKDPENNEEKKLLLIVPQEFSNQSNQPNQKNQLEIPNISTSAPEDFPKKESTLPDENEEKCKELVTLSPVEHNKQMISSTSNPVDSLHLDENKFLTPSPKEENENHSTVQTFTTEPATQIDEENHKNEEDDVPGDKKSNCTDSESKLNQNKNSDQEKNQPSDSVPNPHEEDHQLGGPKAENHLQDLPSVTPSDSKPSLPVSGIYSQSTTSPKVNPIPVRPTIPIKPTAGVYPNYEDVASLKPTTFQTTSVEPTSPKINSNLPTPIFTRPFLQTSSPYTPVESDEDVSIRPLPSSTHVYPIRKEPFHEDDEDEDDCCSCESCREGEVKNPREHRGTVCKDLEEARRELKAIFDKIKKKLKCGRKTLSTINPH